MIHYQVNLAARRPNLHCCHSDLMFVFTREIQTLQHPPPLQCACVRACVCDSTNNMAKK